MKAVFERPRQSAKNQLERKNTRGTDERRKKLREERKIVGTRHIDRKGEAEVGESQREGDP